MARKVSFFNKVEEFGENSCVIEFQAFRGNADEFIIKELVILDLQSGVTNYFLFKPPFSFKYLQKKAARTNKWLINYFHHIPWSDGYTEYNELDNVMYYYCDKYNTIYSTGSEKCKWINMYTSSRVCDYSAYKTKSVSSSIYIGVKSEKHKHSNCAMANSYQLASALSSSCESGNYPSRTSSSGGGNCGGG